MQSFNEREKESSFLSDVMSSSDWHRRQVPVLVIFRFCEGTVSVTVQNRYHTNEKKHQKDLLKKVYDKVTVSIPLMAGSFTKSGSIKKKTGISTVSPAFSLCSSKQKHWILLKYGATWPGVTL